MAGTVKRKSTGRKKTTTKGKATPKRTTTTKSAATRSTSSRAKSTTSRSTASKKVIPQKSVIRSISPERKVDIVGIIMVVIGVLSLLSLFTANTGVITSWWVKVLSIGIGWGAYVLPVVLIVFGFWLLLRNINRFPQVSTERVVGLFLGFINLLVWFHMITDGSLNTALTGIGGGYIGAVIKVNAVRMLGKPGAIIALVAWLITALILILDFSMADLSKWFGNQVQSLRTKVSAYISTQKLKVEDKKRQVALGTPRTTLSTSGLTQANTPKTPETARLPQPGATPTPLDLLASTDGGTPGKHEWILPVPMQVLAPIKAAPADEEDDEHRARVIEETLRSFSTPARVVEIKRGPTITLFGVEPDYIESRGGRTKVRVSNIVRLADDLAMALRASQIRIQAPVPSKGYIGIEVPNRETAPVSLMETIHSPAFMELNAPLKFALGKDVSGNAAATDLTNMPHLLIAGATNSGKSVCINAILACYLLTNTPDQLRLVMVDTKRVELTGYNGIPHLLAPVIVDADRVLGALQWMLREMDMRYRKFSDCGVRNITEYNLHQKSQSESTLPYLVVVIDELADMMMLAPDETEKALTRLAQLARATGIHLIIATQRPSTDILTGLIKANFTARIAFAVASGVDSRVILDQPGAERLLGRGDMLFQAPDAAAPVRLQGTFVSDQEIDNLTFFWRQQAAQAGAPSRPEQAIAFSPQSHIPFKQVPLWEELQKDPDEDPITDEAIAYIRKEGRASISMLQKKFRIGYTRSARLIDALEDKGIISAPNPQTQSREVLDYGKIGPPVEQN